MPIVGLTGSFGTGKSTVARMLADCGAYVIDVDALVSKLWKKPSVMKKAQIFLGKEIVQEGKLDRGKVAEIVFNNKTKLKRLNELIHPLVEKEVKRLIRQNQKKEVIVIDAPLLLEAKWSMFDVLVVVKANQKLQIQRVAQRMGLSRLEILRRIAQQWSIRKKLKMADYVVDNRGSRSSTHKQVKKIYKDIIDF